MNKLPVIILTQLKKSKTFIYCLVLFLLGLFFSLLLNLGTASAQTKGTVEIVQGYLEAGESKVYTIPDLQPGETVYVYVERTSDNLDPIIALASQRSDWSDLRDKFRQQRDKAIAEGQDPIKVFAEFADSLFLAWDDDSGEGYDAVLKFQVPETGNYNLIVADSPNTETFGEYNLLIGINEPKVLTGKAEPTRTQIIEREESLSDPSIAIEILSGSLTFDNSETFFELQDFKADDTLYVFVEATSGDLKPIIELRDYGNKLLRTGNFSGAETQATFEYKFQEDNNTDFRLKLFSYQEKETTTTGEYLLAIGVNVPEVLTGKVEAKGVPIVQKATPVQIGLKLQQITDINQKEENFGIVASLRMEYLDSNLSFSPDSCQCGFKQFRADKFVDFLTEQGLQVPSFSIFNQQGRRATQNSIVIVFPNGGVIYFERFTVTLQAPDFDFRRYPLDKQDFYIHIDSILPKEFYVYQDLEGFSEVGPQLGEEEWIVTEFDTEITDQDLSTGNISTRFSFHFQAKRHLNYYILRLFIPLLIIVIISWLPFFLRDYGKRVDISSGNLLLFIAYNFTLSNDLPRLGYVTFLDEVLLYMFIVSGLLVLLNVYVRRLEILDKKDQIAKIDQYIIWGYPLLYFTMMLIAIT